MSKKPAEIKVKIGIAEGDRELIRQITFPGIRDLFVHLYKNSRQITTLDFSKSELGKNLKEFITIFSQLRFLRSLNLGNMDIGDNYLPTVLDHISQLRLHNLGLSGNAISSAGVETLAKVAATHHFLPELQTLDLRYNPSIGNQGAQILAENLCYMPQLRILDLRFSSVGTAGTEALKTSALDFTSLQIDLNSPTRSFKVFTPQKPSSANQSKTPRLSSEQAQKGHKIPQQKELSLAPPSFSALPQQVSLPPSQVVNQEQKRSEEKNYRKPTLDPDTEIMSTLPKSPLDPRSTKTSVSLHPAQTPQQEQPRLSDHDEDPYSSDLNGSDAFETRLPRPPSPLMRAKSALRPPSGRAPSYKQTPF